MVLGVRGGNVDGVDPAGGQHVRDGGEGTLETVLRGEGLGPLLGAGDHRDHAGGGGPVGGGSELIGDVARRDHPPTQGRSGDRKSTRLNSSHVAISYAVFCLKKKR